MSESTCFVRNCSNTGGGRCIQCGNWYCHHHGGQEAGYGSYCQPCYTLIVEGLLITSHCAGQLPEALEILDGFLSASLSPEHIYYKAIGLAMTGELDRAVYFLEDIATANGHETPKLTNQALGNTLSARAARYMHDNKIIDAVNDLRQASALLEDNITQYAVLSALVHQAAAAFFKEGHLTEAISEWEKAQAQDVQNTQIAHYLGICYYRLASHMEVEAPSEAEAYWQKAIANWVIVICDDDYLATWAKSREAAVGNINQTVLEDVRQKLKDRLRNEFRDFRTSYLEQQSADAQRYANLEVDFVRELRTAEEMSRIMRQNDTSQGTLQAVCGPLMLAAWRRNPKLDEAIQALEQLSPELQNYLSPLGYAYTLVKDMRRYDDALPILRNWCKKNNQDKGGQSLLLEVLTEKGRLALASKDHLQAVTALEEAVQLNINQHTVRPLLAEAATKQALEWLEQDETVQKAIDLLERIQKRHQIYSTEVKAQLAQAYFRRALIHNHKGDNKNSLADLRKSLEIDPDNQMALQNFATVVQNRAAELAGENQFDDAINLINEVIALNPQQVNGELMVGIVFQRGIFRANTAVEMVNKAPRNPAMRQLARNILQGAVADLETAVQLAPANTHFRKQLNIVRNTLRQMNS